MQTTDNYGLKKPEETDVVNIGDLNDNMDLIDGIMAKRVIRRILTLAAAGWSDSYPYSQTVKAEGITADDDIKVAGVYIPDGASIDRVKAWNKAAGFLMYSSDGVADGKVTFKAYKKPAVDFQVITEGA